MCDTSSPEISSFHFHPRFFIPRTFILALSSLYFHPPTFIPTLSSPLGPKCLDLNMVTNVKEKETWNPNCYIYFWANL